VKRLLSAVREALLALAVVWLVPLLLLALILPIAAAAWFIAWAVEQFGM
jgi:hypothetical protein